MMEACGPISPTSFDFGMGEGAPAGAGDFNLNEFVASPPDEHQTDDFMASFTLDGNDTHSVTHPSYEDGQGGQQSSLSELGPPSTSSHPSGGSVYGVDSPAVSYPAMSIPQLQQLHQQLVASSSNPSTPQHSHSPASVSPAGPSSLSHGHQQPAGPSESDLQAILDSMLVQSPQQQQQQQQQNQGGASPTNVGLGGMDIGSLMGQLAGMGQGGGGQLHQHHAPPPSSFPRSPLGHPPQQQDETATALQRLQQLQQLQHYQSQFIQQQLDQLTRQATEQQQKQHQHQQQQQQPSGHFRSQSLDAQNHLIRQGLPTPAHSSELYATMHQEMVSPIHMPGGAPGMYRDSSEYDLDGNLLFTPMMSPAMSQSNHTTPGSAYQSINPHPTSTDFFSPLTSPALGPVYHSTDYNRVSSAGGHSYNPGMSPHLLAQTSSMTMSPHLLAQQQHQRLTSAPGSPVTNRRTTSSSGRSRSSRGTGSAATNGAGGVGGPEGKHAKTRPSPLMKPTAGSSSSRRRKEGQAMPSPIGVMSPHQLPLDGIGEMEMSDPQAYNTNHPAHYQPSSATASPSSSQFAPPSAIPPNLDQTNSSESNSSPSPVDLASLQMPPPPVPTASQRRSSTSSSNNSNMAPPALPPPSISPQTPATFLNLSRPSSATSITPMSTTPANPSPLASPYLSAADSSSTSTTQREGQTGSRNGAAGTGIAGLVDAPRSNGVAKQQQQQQQPVASTSTSASNGIIGGARGIGSGTGANFKPPLIAPVGKGKTPGAAPRAARKLGPGGKPIARPQPPPSPAPTSSSKPVLPPPEIRKTSHREAEQRRRDSLKAGFDELRVLLPPINPDFIDPDTGLPIAGASMPRLPARSPLIPDDNPNRGVSKVALLRCSNKHIGLLNGRVERRDDLVARLRAEVERLRGVAGVSWEAGEEGEVDILVEDVDLVERDEEDEYDEEEGYYDGTGGEGMEDVPEGEEQQEVETKPVGRRASVTKAKGAGGVGGRTSMGRAAAAVASARIRQGEEEEGEGEGEGMDQS